jgi:ubiquitin-protein ligase
MLMIIDSLYPDYPPKILAKTNFCTPSLMDGRDLFNNICENWNKNMKLIEIVNLIPKFLANVINTKSYKFYGRFHLGAIYDMKNFDNMIVSKIYIYLFIFYR